MTFISSSWLHDGRAALLLVVVARGASLNGHPQTQVDRDSVELGAAGEAQRPHAGGISSAARPLMRSEATGASDSLSELLDPAGASSLVSVEDVGSAPESKQDALAGRQRWEVDAAGKLKLDQEAFMESKHEAEQQAPKLLKELHQATQKRVEQLSKEKHQVLPSDTIMQGLQDHHVLDYFEARVPPESLMETHAEGNAQNEMAMVPGMNAADLAYKAMDLLYGTSGIIPEDYPYACICGASGLCEGDTMKTTCKGRKGTGSGAQRIASSTAFAALLFPVAAIVCGLSRSL